VLTEDDVAHVAWEEKNHGAIHAAVFAAAASLADLAGLRAIAYYHSSDGDQPLIEYPPEIQRDFCENVIEIAINLDALGYCLRELLGRASVNEVLAQANDYPATIEGYSHESYTAAAADLSEGALTWVRLCYKLPHDEGFAAALREHVDDVAATVATLDRLAPYGRIDLMLADLQLVKERQRCSRFLKPAVTTDGETDRRTTGPVEIGNEARAIALLREHPDWTHAQIAEAVPCHRGTLYRYKSYMAARQLLRERPYARGSKVNGKLEAWVEDE